MVLIKEEITAEGIEYTFSHYQDAYKKAQRIQAKTGFVQSAQHTNAGYTVIEPKDARRQPPNKQPMQRQQSMQQGYQEPQQQMYPEPQQQNNIPENLGYETPPRMPPGLYDGNW